MKNFFGNLRYRFQQWSQGRYGNDELNKFLSIAAIVFIIIALFGRLWSPLQYCLYAGLVLLIFQIIRAFSKNRYAREKERDFYLKVKGRIVSFFKLQKKRWTQRETSKFYRCPKCRQVIRVPRGRGRIAITCPKCKTEFVKRT